MASPTSLSRRLAAWGYEATMYLLERGVRLTGTDAWSWDAPFVPHRAPSHAETGERRPHLGRATRPGATSATATWRSCATSRSLPPARFHHVSCFPVKIRARLGRLDPRRGDLRRRDPGRSPPVKLASRAEGPDGRLLVVSRDMRQAVEARAAKTMQQALETWTEVEADLRGAVRRPERGRRAKRLCA
jgi:hypothetical protein